jgi:large subunit ribosomal protein L11
MCLSIKHKVYIKVKSQTAETGPPLGTVLGNLGVNTVKFCKEFNEFTMDLPNYFQLRLEIIIYENKSFNFNCKEPSTGYILSLLKKEEVVNDGFVSLIDIIKLAKFKLSNLPLEKSIKVILGSLRSSNLLLRFEEDDFVKF